ncbi:MAG: protein phosphatase 2C family protein [Myxococcales bacterium]|nr:protein phosphatase 2C family protein [Myxococcales bacterium]
MATTTASFRPDSLVEDRLAVHHVRGGIVVVVADGAGGVSGGGEAAEVALHQVGAALAQPGLEPFVSGSWVEVHREADREIERDGVAGETTCVVVAISDDGQLVGASCGDSGALVVERGGAADDLTRDQHRKRRLGTGRAVPVAFERATLRGTLVVATDGLLAYARPSVVAEVVLGAQGDLEEVVRALVECVRPPGRGELIDDVAVVVVGRGAP